MKCSRCGVYDAVVKSDVGGLCSECAAEHMGIPVTGKQRAMACVSCRTRIASFPLYLAGEFWHKECLVAYMQKNGCPKCRSKLNSRGECLGCRWTIEKMIQQGEIDASAMIGNEKELCRICLKFNTAVAAGLPFYPGEPEASEYKCSMCKAPICSRHMAYPPDGNILGLDRNQPFCSGAYVLSCIEKLEKKVKCIADDCPTHDDHNNRTVRRDYRGNDEVIIHYDPLKDAKHCEVCDGYYCGEYHEKCPDCVGIKCDDCSEYTPKEELYPIGNYMSPDLVCSDCLSNRTCGQCGTEIEPEEGLCDSCREEENIKEGNIVFCDICNEKTEADKITRAFASPETDDNRLWLNKPDDRLTYEVVDVCEYCANDIVDDEEPPTDAPGQTTLF